MGMLLKSGLYEGERPGLLSGSAAHETRMMAEPSIDYDAATQPLPSWIKWGGSLPFTISPAIRGAGIASGFVRKGADEIIEGVGDAVNLGRTLVKQFPKHVQIGKDILTGELLKGQLKRTLEKVTDQAKDKEYPFDVGVGEEDYGEFLGPKGIGEVGEAERLEQIHVDQQYSNYPNWNRDTKRWEHGGEFKPGWDEFDPILVDIWSEKASAINRSVTKQELLAEGRLTRRQIESMPDSNYMGENSDGDYEWDDEGYLVKKDLPPGTTTPNQSELPFRVGKEVIVRLSDGRVVSIREGEGQDSIRDDELKAIRDSDNVFSLGPKLLGKDPSNVEITRSGIGLVSTVKEKIESGEILDEIDQQIINKILFEQPVVDDDLNLEGWSEEGLNNVLESGFYGYVDRLFEGLENEEIEFVKDEMEVIAEYTANRLRRTGAVIPFPVIPEDLTLGEATPSQIEEISKRAARRKTGEEADILDFPQSRTIGQYEVRTELQKDKTYKVYITNNNTEETKEVPYIPEITSLFFGDMNKADMGRLTDVLAKMFTED